MAVRVGWRQVHSWRMGRQLLDPVGDRPVEEVVSRLCGVQAQVASSAELAVRVRMGDSAPGVVARALEDGRLIKTWAMRGSLHLLNPADGGAYLSLMAAGRSWERPSWVRYFGATPEVMARLRDAVAEALDDAALSREELIDAVVATPGLDHVGEALRSGWGTLLKPLAWQGVLCHGPSRGSRVSFTRPDLVSPRWTGLPEPDEAAPIALVAYLGAYGPATVEAFGNWLTGGWFGKRQLRAWAAELGGRLVEVEVDGQPALSLAEHVDDLASTVPTEAVRLLPGFDLYVLGPGTADGHVVPPTRRAAVSRQAGWISPVVVAAGVVSGTWELDGDVVRVAWFAEAGAVPRRAIAAEVDHLATILGRHVLAEISLAPDWTD
ncbi:MAG TPA: crosslink repair DNA glycosylase YcaQ family protein [Candidatus Limnocylindrales bacterium]|nr:crosslink repair DNA glycosylase YcaQ family protein [Candidatus Limnocylindrales bacterium]